ncbi:alpha/beta fold hydrolase [Thalassobacillus hwangdonensis]|uniref:Alpha/beta fold hydrolase n=1 Tax=Thalassobacillus hwangdonensis TaxID=546108 RepID=A0ABW3KY50_9BACI
MATVFKSKQKSWIVLLTASLFFSLAVFFTNSTPTSSKDNGKVTPTVFVHGYKGGTGSFNTMLRRFQNDRIGMKQLMIRVSEDGSLQYIGRILDDKNPFVQIVFENNRASIADQTLWMKKVMHSLRHKYGIEQVNLVGHSMGGLASTNFLLESDRSDYPRVEKLVVMGSPFKGIEREDYFSYNYGEATVDLKPGSDALESMLKRKDAFPEHIEVLTIAGVVTKDVKLGDGLVSLDSAIGIEDIVPSERYHEKIFKDPAATHSGLHEHTGIDKVLAAFLWNIKANN